MSCITSDYIKLYSYIEYVAARTLLGVSKATYASICSKVQSLLGRDFILSKRASYISTHLGHVHGLTMRDARFRPMELVNAEDNFVREWNCRLGVTVASPSPMQTHSCGFFEAMLRGVLDFRSPSSAVMLSLRKKVMLQFLEMWGDQSSHKFRTCVWEQPEFKRYHKGRTQFRLDALTEDWLGESNYAVRVRRVMIEVFASVFNIQIGIVSLNCDGHPCLFTYGQFGCVRVYIAWNGHNDHLQQYYYFKKSEFLMFS